MSAFTGTGELLRLAVRRDRVRLPVWIAVFAFTAAFSAAATAALYPTTESRVQAAEAINVMPSLVAMYGPIHDPASFGATAVFKLTAFGATLVGLLVLLTVVRHTRAQEASGSLELLGGSVLGRYAAPAAALFLAASASAVLGLTTAAGLMAAGLPVAGSAVFGLGWAACGMVFGAVAAVTAQLARSTRGATGLATGALVLAFGLRAVGDSAGPRWLSWLSPIGWVQQARPYAGERWWVLLVPLTAAALIAALSLWLQRGRDLGAGVVPERAFARRPGRGQGGVWGLAWRLNRTGLFAWASVYFLLGLLAGSLADGVGAFTGNPNAEALFRALGGEKGISEAFLATELAMAGIATAAYAIHVCVHLRVEEEAFRVEPLLASAVSRTKLLGGYLLLIVGGGAVLLVAVGAGAGLAYGAVTGRLGAELPRLVAAALAQFPAVLVLGGLAVALFGLVPRWLTTAWVALVAALLVAEVGPLLRAPRWVLDLSPFTHLPKLPGGAVAPAALAWLTALALAFALAGLGGFRRRDLETA